LNWCSSSLRLRCRLVPFMTSKPLAIVAVMLVGRRIAASQKRVRRALVLLEELDDQLRVLGSSTLPQHVHVCSLVAARRRVRLAMAALGSRPDSVRSWAGFSSGARADASPRAALAGPVVLVARIVRSLAWSVWRCLRAVLWLLRALRAISL
jgi:hypothetical protein